MKIIFKIIIVLLLIMLTNQCFQIGTGSRVVRNLYPCHPPVRRPPPPPPPRPPVSSSTTIVVYCVTTVQIFWKYSYGRINISVFVFTTCYTIIIHHTYWRNRCLKQVSLGIDHRIASKSNPVLGGEFKIKSDFNNKGVLKGYQEQDKNGKTTKKLSIAKIIKKTTVKRQINIEVQFKSKFNTSLKKKNINPPKKKLNAARSYISLWNGPPGTQIP